jgi:hypothetical protein
LGGSNTFKLPEVRAPDGLSYARPPGSIASLDRYVWATESSGYGTTTVGAKKCHMG